MNKEILSNEEETNEELMWQPATKAEVEATGYCAVTGITLTETTLELEKKRSHQMKYTVSPANATDKRVCWQAIPAGIVNMGPSGLVCPIKVGKTTIIVTTLDGGRKATCDVTIVPNKLTASNKLIAFIKEYEGFSAKPYRGADSQNRTIGYGHVITSDDGTKYDNGITEAEATELLKDDLERVVYTYLNPWLAENLLTLTQNQYDALVDFTFNTGHSWLTKYYDLRNILLSGNITYEKMYNEFMQWIKCDGQKLTGLYRRRMDELEIFFNNEYTREYPSMPDDV